VDDEPGGRARAILELVLAKAAVTAPVGEREGIAGRRVLVSLQDMFRQSPIFDATGQVVATLQRGTLEDALGRCLVRRRRDPKATAASSQGVTIHVRKPRWTHLVESGLEVDGTTVASVVGKSRRQGTLVDCDDVELGRVGELSLWSRQLWGWRLPTNALVLGWARFRIVEITEDSNDLLLRFLALTAQLYDGSEGAGSANVERTVLLETP
jgi:hypothetical protein